MTSDGIYMIGYIYISIWHRQNSSLPVPQGPIGQHWSLFPCKGYFTLARVLAASTRRKSH